MDGHGWAFALPSNLLVAQPSKLSLTSDLWQHTNNISIPEHVLFLFNFYFPSYYEQVRAV